jgi:AhpD family alkylhydroperoxidase
MKARIELTHTPDAIEAMLTLQAYVDGLGLPARMLELIKIRASQLNGCARCIDMHTVEARARGETEQRIYALDAWRETPFFDASERAALAWTEAVTLLDDRVPDQVYALAREQFDERTLVSLTMAVVAINGWNRLNVAFRTVPGKPRAGH